MLLVQILCICYPQAWEGLKVTQFNRHSFNARDSHLRLMESLNLKIKDQRVLEVMARTSREAFLPDSPRHLVYKDIPLPIGYGQTISQPLIVAMMIEALSLTGNESILEVGTGSGYQTALLAQLANEVVSVERIPELAVSAQMRFKLLRLKNVKIEVASDVLGFPECSPYHRIIVSAASPKIPISLLDQLCNNGIMVIPVGSRLEQDLHRITKLRAGMDVQKLGLCRFVPLVGIEAWER